MRKGTIFTIATLAVFNNRIEYAVVGDTGPAAIIGIDPDPKTGGTDSGVTYIFFKNFTVSPIENHSQAVSVGQQLARQFINNN